MSTRHFRSLHTILGLVVVISVTWGGSRWCGLRRRARKAPRLAGPRRRCAGPGKSSTGVSSPWRSLVSPLSNSRDRGATPGRRDQAAAAAALWALRSDALAGGCIPRRSLCRQAQGICGYRGHNGVVGVQHLRHGCKSFRRGPQYSAISRRSRVGCTSSG